MFTFDFVASSGMSIGFWTNEHWTQKKKEKSNVWVTLAIHWSDRWTPLISSLQCVNPTLMNIWTPWWCLHELFAIFFLYFGWTIASENTQRCACRRNAVSRALPLMHDKPYYLTIKNEKFSIWTSVMRVSSDECDWVAIADDYEVFFVWKCVCGALSV